MLCADPDAPQALRRLWSALEGGDIEVFHAAAAAYVAFVRQEVLLAYVVDELDSDALELGHGTSFAGPVAPDEADARGCRALAWLVLRWLAGGAGGQSAGSAFRVLRERLSLEGRPATDEADGRASALNALRPLHDWLAKAVLGPSGVVVAGPVAVTGAGCVSHESSLAGGVLLDSETSVLETLTLRSAADFDGLSWPPNEAVDRSAAACGGGLQEGARHIEESAKVALAEGAKVW